jgi:hypothetical protein
MKKSGTMEHCSKITLKTPQMRHYSVPIPVPIPVPLFKKSGTFNKKWNK